MSPTVDSHTLASLSNTLQACQQALQSLQITNNTQANTVATGINDSPSTNQSPISDINSPSVNMSDDPVTTVPISTNVATNMPITNLPFIGSPVTTTPIAGNSVNTVAPYSNDAVVGTTAVGNAANVVSVSNCPVTIVSFADSPTSTNVADAQVGAFLTSLTTLIQQNFLNASNSDSDSSPAIPPSDQDKIESVKPVLEQLQALGFSNTQHNLSLLMRFEGDYFQTLNQLLAERRSSQ